MGKYTSAKAHTPADAVRSALSESERILAAFPRFGPKVVTILPLFDAIVDGLENLESAGMDVRAERARFETVQRLLDRNKGRFLKEAGDALQKARRSVDSDQAGWWWQLDERWRQEKRSRLRHRLVVGGIVVGVLIVLGLVYDLFLAPPREFRRALRHASRGESLVQSDRDLQAALVEFEAATQIYPSEPENWIWVGVLYLELDDEQAAQDAFATARSLYDTQYAFLLKRAEVYAKVGELDAAMADVDQVILENPDMGWAYYIRHSIYVDRGDIQSAIADLERADELAQESGDLWLQAQARVQRGMLMQSLPVSPVETPLETPAP